MRNFSQIVLGKILELCTVCIEHWDQVGRRRAYSIFLFIAVYALPVFLVLTAYIRMGFKLCSPSVVNKGAEGIIQSPTHKGRKYNFDIWNILSFPKRRWHNPEKWQSPAGLPPSCRSHTSRPCLGFRPLLDAVQFNSTRIRSLGRRCPKFWTL